MYLLGPFILRIDLRNKNLFFHYNDKIISLINKNYYSKLLRPEYFLPKKLCNFLRITEAGTCVVFEEYPLIDVVAF